MKEAELVPWNLRACQTLTVLKRIRIGVASLIKSRNLLNNPTDIPMSDWGKALAVFYIQGPSKTGKSIRLARKILTDLGAENRNMIKFDGTFWHGVGTTCKYAVYDEFRDSHMKPSEFINLIDYDKHMMRILHGSIRNCYEVIIITSVQKLDELYPKAKGTETKNQWIRRCQVIDWYSSEKSKYETDEMYSWRIPILNKYEDELEGKKSGKKKSKRKIITIVTSSESSDEESSIH